MVMREIKPTNVEPTQGNYSHAVAVTSGSRQIFISGQIPTLPDGRLPDGFEAQADAVWANIENILSVEGLSFKNLAKVTIYLSSREYADKNGEVRRKYLGSHRPALTVIIAQIYDPKWLLEIEAVAVG